MEEIGNQKQRRVASSNSIGRCLISFVSSSLTQLSLFLLPSFFPSFSLLSLSAVALWGVTGVGRCCKRLVAVEASAPAFVFFDIKFIWGVFIGMFRQAHPAVLKHSRHPLSAYNGILMTLYSTQSSLCSILTTDPGYVTNESSHHNQLVESPVSVFEAHSEELVPSTRDIPYEFVAEEVSQICRHCKAYVKGFNHHCPAFGNCIGQKNRVLFIILLVGFVFTEASYVACSSQSTSSSRNLAICTMLFSLLQVLWNMLVNVYRGCSCCFNIKTDEWLET
ncbi:unnamed protein product [Camellia sinensis]